jgi:hypothetical protein
MKIQKVLLVQILCALVYVLYSNRLDANLKVLLLEKYWYIYNDFAKLMCIQLKQNQLMSNVSNYFKNKCKYFKIKL